MNVKLKDNKQTNKGMWMIHCHDTEIWAQMEWHKFKKLEAGKKSKKK